MADNTEKKENVTPRTPETSSTPETTGTPETSPLPETPEVSKQDVKETKTQSPKSTRYSADNKKAKRSARYNNA